MEVEIPYNMTSILWAPTNIIELDTIGIIEIILN